MKISNSPEFKELADYIARHRTELEATTSDEQKHIFNKMMDN